MTIKLWHLSVHIGACMTSFAQNFLIIICCMCIMGIMWGHPLYPRTAGQTLTYIMSSHSISLEPKSQLTIKRIKSLSLVLIRFNIYMYKKKQYILTNIFVLFLEICEINCWLDFYNFEKQSFFLFISYNYSTNSWWECNFTMAEIITQ